MPSVEWVEPALVWNGRKLNNLLRPRLAEFATDNFLPEFIDALSAVGPEADPAEYLDQRLLASTTTPRLFQPLHGRYYLVTASLVCRQLGLPDKVVDQANGESVAFVLRRARPDGANGPMIEQGWIDEGPQRGWHPVDATGVVAGEERFPMHPLKVCTSSRPSMENLRSVHVCLQERVIYHGYLATGNREKYREPDPAISDPQAYIAAINSQSSLENFRYNEFDTRVVSVWADLDKREDKIGDDQVQQLSLYLILDLGDYLQRALPAVWDAVTAADINRIPASRTAQRALYTTLESITIGKGSGTIALRAALTERQNDLALVQGEGTEPDVTYDFRDVSRGALETNVANALNEEPAAYQMTDEMVNILQNLVKPEQTDTNNQPAERYFIRLVYDYSPDCPPIVSERSQEFTFAKFFDSDAPARLIRLELPDITMQNLRKFKRGVGMQMSPDLRKLMGRINEDTLDGELGPEGPGWELGMICTFSLQIIFLVAFIVMFIFLILLNIVFWWLPFLRICFPIPRRSS